MTGKDISGFHQQRKLSLATRPDTEPEILTALFGDRSERVKDAAIQHPKIPTSVLVEAAMADDERWRLRAAAHQSTPPDTLEALVDDPHIPVVCELLTHSEIPETVLLRAVRRCLDHSTDNFSEQTAVRHALCSLSEAENAPLGALRMLIDSIDVDIHRRVASNPNTDEALSRRLCGSPDDFTREAIASRHDLPEDMQSSMANDHNERVKYAIAQQDELPVAALDRLAQDTHAPVLKALHRQPRLTGDHLRYMSSHEDTEIRMAVAQHKAASEDTLILLAMDSNSSISQSASNALSRRQAKP